jgi:hypothetical protein
VLIRESVGIFAAKPVTKMNCSILFMVT